MSGTAGLWMLGTLALVLVATGLPAWVALIGVASLFAIAGVMAGAFPLALLAALPGRLLGLLENDLLQALPLYVLIGALLNHLPLARTLFRCGARAFARTGAGAELAGLSLGMLLAPMNGSVGASVAMLTRTVLPRLRDAGLPAEESAALVCVASTLGVVVPPSLVLILAADAMMRAHTEAVNATGIAARIINTQDVFVGALIPAIVLLALFGVVAWYTSKGRTGDDRPIAPSRRENVTASIAAIVIAGLLGAVTLGYVYAVEAAAAGGMALLLYGAMTRTLTRHVLSRALRDALAITGALFALLVGATVFTLVVRAFGTDRWVATSLANLHAGPLGTIAVAMGCLALCALVLDAFEIIFVVVPVLMPPVLVQVGDATWAAVLALQILQASFLIPPFGYAVLMVRNFAEFPIMPSGLARALAPYLVALLAVVALTVAWPGIVARRDTPRTDQASPAQSTDEERRMLQRQLDENAERVPSAPD